MFIQMIAAVCSLVSVFTHSIAVANIALPGVKKKKKEQDQSLLKIIVLDSLNRIANF